MIASPTCCCKGVHGTALRSLLVLFVSGLSITLAHGVVVAPRECHDAVRHLHIAVGKDPSTQMTISFASQWAKPGEDIPMGGVHLGTSPTNLTRVVWESELPDSYASFDGKHKNEHYYSPYQHHITLDGLTPSTTYYYVAVTRHRPDHGKENLEAESKVLHSQENMNASMEDSGRALRHQGRRLGPPPYDGHLHECLDATKVRSFTTAPAPGSRKAKSATFAIVGDLGQFTHSQETVAHMKNHKHEYDAAMLVGDIAYTEFDHRRWDTFFDFLDDFAAFDELPLQIATGNHGTYEMSTWNGWVTARTTSVRHL